MNGERRYRPEDGWEIAVYREWYRATFDPEDPLIIPLPDSLHTGDGAIRPMNWLQKSNLNTKLVYQPKPALTASYSFFFSKSESQGFANSWKFAPDGSPTNFGDNQTHIFVLTHAPRENVFYNMRYSLQENHSKNFAFEDANDPLYQITAVNSWDPGINTGYDYGGIRSWDRTWFDQRIHLANGDFTWQINQVIEVKAGFEGKSYRLRFKNAPMRERLGFETLQFPFTQSEIRGLELPYVFFRDSTANYEFGNVRLRETHPDSAGDDQFYVDYNRYPREAAGFVQTTLSLGEIILNAGVRTQCH